MPIHEKDLIRPENIKSHEHLVVDGVDVSGHWSTFIETRVVKDYNEALEEEISSLPGGENIHRCWQCGSCTNSCTVNAINPDFNPRFWIYLIRMGMEEELLRDKEIIWQCVSCNKCTYACPRDVVPEGVMKATAHWLELKGHVKPSPSTVFDDVFSNASHRNRQDRRGPRRCAQFFARTGQALTQDWVVEMVKRMLAHLPVTMLVRLGLAGVLAPRTRGWAGARDAIKDYVAEQDAHHRKALGIEQVIELAKQEAALAPPQAAK